MGKEKWVSGFDAVSFTGTGDLKDRQESGLEVAMGSRKNIHQDPGF